MEDNKMLDTLSTTTCPECGRGLRMGMHQLSYCAAFIVLQIVEARPGKTAWELAQMSGIPYSSVTKGLNRARAEAWVGIEAEDREQGGIRYRYSNPSVPDDAKRMHRATVARYASGGS